MNSEKERTVEEHFEYLLRVGAGWNQARLTLADDTSQIEYESAWMGGVPVRYVAQAKHTRLSDLHGVLDVTLIEQYVTRENEFGGHILTGEKEMVDLVRLINPDDDEAIPRFYNEILLEYVRFPQPQIRLDEQGGNWGIHDWTGNFSLILLLHEAGIWYDPEGEFIRTPLGRGLASLDCLHFAIAEGKYSPRLVIMG